MLTKRKATTMWSTQMGNLGFRRLFQLESMNTKESIVGVVFTVLLLTTVGLGFAVLIKLLLGVLL